MENKGTGLKILPPDNRDIKFGAIYKLPALSELPDEFEVEPPLSVKNQMDKDFCASFAGTAVSEDQEGVELDPLYQFARAKQISGDYKEWGADLRSMAKSFINYGSIEKRDAPYTIEQDRDFLANPDNYSIGFDTLAAKHKKQSYMFIETSGDFFENIRKVLWANREKEKSALIGVMWNTEWNNSVVDFLGTPYFGHAVKVVGWVKKNGQTLLKILNSWGKENGDNGYYYFSKEVINANKEYGALVFTDMPKEEAKYLNENGIRFGDNWILQAIKIIWSFIRNLFDFPTEK